MLVLRSVAILLSLGGLTSLAADNARRCADEIACRWPAAAQQLEQASPEAAATWINELAASDEFEVRGVQHYPENP